MQVYIVAALNDYTKYFLVEVYSTLEVALSRGIHLAKEDFAVSNDLINETPEAQVSNDCTQWVLVGTTSDLITVIRSEVESSLPHCRGGAQQILDGLVNTTVGTISGGTLSHLDDPFEESLPAGWNWDNKPITMQDLYNDPFCIKPTSQLTKVQQWALTKARVSKRPNYSVLLPLGTFVQSSALQVLGEPWTHVTENGIEIIIQECQLIDNYAEDLQAARAVDDVTDLD
jgi:hypothetical protein